VKGSIWTDNSVKLKPRFSLKEIKMRAKIKKLNKEGLECSSRLSKRSEVCPKGQASLPFHTNSKHKFGADKLEVQPATFASYDA
jgi:DNA-binding transcriptional regulator PaaX